MGEKLLILSDSKAAIQAITSHKIIQNKEILECRNLITALQLKHKTLVLQWIPSHCGTKGNEIADKLAKRGAMCLQQPTSLTSYHSATIIIKQTVKGTFKSNLQSRTQEKQWKDIAKITPDAPRKTAVAHFRLNTGHDCLAAHLFRIGIYTSPHCPLCNTDNNMDRTHLLQCQALHSTSIQDKYWEARSKLSAIE